MYLGLELVLELDPKYGRGQVSQNFRLPIYILIDTIVFGEVNRLHDVHLLNITQYNNCTVRKSEYEQVHLGTHSQANCFNIPLRNDQGYRYIKYHNNMK